MQRRSILYAMLGLAPAAQAWQDAANTIPTTAAEAAAMGLPKFFTEADFAAFAALGEILVPAFDGRPGAKEAEAAAFLDFLLGQSPADIQTLYRQGIAVYRTRSRAGVESALKELTAPWSYAGPQSSYGKFLQAAKLAFHQATVNSRQWAEAMSTRSRSAAGIGSYWLPVE
jgi:hypothetical protein